MLIGVDPLTGKGLLVYCLNTSYLAMQSHNIRGMHYKGAYYSLIPENWQCICLHKKYIAKQSIVSIVLKLSECVKALSIMTVCSRDDHPF